jgi:hypothetical protein
MRLAGSETVTTAEQAAPPITPVKMQIIIGTISGVPTKGWISTVAGMRISGEIFIVRHLLMQLNRLDDVAWKEEFNDPIREYTHFAIESR